MSPAVRIASDWHLSPESPAVHGALALAFLERARADGARVILNGDIFDDLFAGPGRSQAAHPRVVAAIDALRAAGRLERTRGNHDPGGGAERVVQAWTGPDGPARVLVCHGHAADPVNTSALGRLGDGISRRFGRLKVVRGAAWLAEAGAKAVLGPRLVSIFRRRCLALVEREGYDLGVFGHVHVAHLLAGDRYANSGALHGETLDYLELTPAGPRLVRLTAADLR